VINRNYWWWWWWWWYPTILYNYCYGKLTVKLPLGNKQKFTNFAIASKAFKDSRKMDR
jgi:hypothetical protein